MIQQVCVNNQKQPHSGQRLKAEEGREQCCVLATKCLFKVLRVTLLPHPFFSPWALSHGILVSLQQTESIHLLINEYLLELGNNKYHHYFCLLSLIQPLEFGMYLKFCICTSLGRDFYSLGDILVFAGLKCSEKCQNGGTCVATTDGRGECM